MGRLHCLVALYASMRLKNVCKILRFYILTLEVDCYKKQTSSLNSQYLKIEKLLVSRTNLIDISKNTWNNELYKISDWLSSNKLSSLNVKKIKYMVFYIPQKNVNYPTKFLIFFYTYLDIN